MSRIPHEHLLYAAEQHQAGVSLGAISRKEWELWGYSSPRSAAEALRRALRAIDAPVRSRIEATRLVSTRHGNSRKELAQPDHPNHDKYLAHRRDGDARKGYTFRVIRAGDRFGRLTVLRDRRRGDKRLAVRCECGTEHSMPVRGWGLSRSCGCLTRETSLARFTTHGHAGTRMYKGWASMVSRCTLETNRRWADYGGRGIRVCDRWNPKAGGSFANFLADMGERPDGMTLDRIDNDGNYEPGNCWWATIAEQNRNRRPPSPITRSEWEMLASLAEVAGEIDLALKIRTTVLKGKRS